MTDTPFRSIDLNADLGEHDGDGFAADNLMLDVVTSASIACGEHAGSREVMRRTIASALARGVKFGAHPSYSDREGFGRRELNLPTTEIIDSVRRQIEGMAECCSGDGTRISYVKPHGALYNRAAGDVALAKALVDCVAGIDRSLVLLALAGSEMERAAIISGLPVVREAFIDRAYAADGTLVPRTTVGAVIEEIEVAAQRAVDMARDGRIAAASGAMISINAASLCVHSDSKNALAIVRSVRKRLESAGFPIESFTV